MTEQSHKKGTFLVTIGLLLIAAALVLTIFNLWTDKNAGESAEEVLRMMSLASESESEATKMPGSDVGTGASDAAGQRVFLPYNDEVRTTSEQDGKWLLIPMDKLVSVDVSEDGNWVFVLFGNVAGLMEISDATGRWLYLPADVIENAQQRDLSVVDSDIQSAQYPDYVLNPDMDMPETEIDGNKYIGVLQIPSLKLKLPVMGKWSYPRLRIAPCLYAGNVYQNNMILCGHNYDRHFGRLKTLKIGAEVDFTDADGNAFRYRVVELETLKPRAVNQMKSGDWDLTLFTCTIGGATRVTVRCERL